MAVRPVVLYETNEAELRRESEPVLRGTRKTKSLISDLKDTLRHHPNGIGLAAPQIGVHQRMVVVCFGAGDAKTRGLPIGIINPVIIEAARGVETVTARSS